MKLKFINILLVVCLFDYTFCVYRNGTTAMNFLEIDIASSRAAMGGAGVSYVKDASSAYWNPAGLVFAKKIRGFIF